MLNSENMILKLRKERDLFNKREFLDFIPTDVVITREAEDIVHDLKEEDQEDTSQPLTDLPDKDASVLCELVYEKSALNVAINRIEFKGVSLANIFYNVTKKYKNDKGQVIYPIRDDMGFNLSKDMLFGLESCSKYYHKILSKYKLVATSSKLGNACNYYGIAIAHAKDKDNKGIYVINRGTTYSTFYEAYSDIFKSDIIDMGMLGKALPVTVVSDHAKAGLKFVDDLLKHKIISNIGFAGHSLGGSIAQNQAVYYANLFQAGVTLSPSKGFEPFGVKNEMDNLFSFSIGSEEDKKLYYLTLNPKKALNSWVCKAGVDWDCGSWQNIPDILVTNYAYYSEHIKFTAFGRKGDAIANLAQSIGTPVPIDSAGSFKDTGKLHSITNYRYQGYDPDGNLITTQVNDYNSDKLKESNNEEQKSRYRMCFDTPTFTNKVDL